MADGQVWMSNGSGVIRLDIPMSTMAPAPANIVGSMWDMNVQARATAAAAR